MTIHHCEAREMRNDVQGAVVLSATYNSNRRYTNFWQDIRGNEGVWGVKKSREWGVQEVKGEGAMKNLR